MTPAVRSWLGIIGAFSASCAASLGATGALVALGAPAVIAVPVSWFIGSVMLGVLLGAVIAAGKRS